ncbi:hypothetical protein C162_07839 [Paenibacillus sp. FSL R7-269]|uniref:YopX family protein n=1 Tax=Paenibacillus sp. FSL R7-269 TaxID=1226755 RepID=UPI0003E2B955|nr:YopX family protein [Paenibacillus sp. FSL R7-269]ETT53147.1 hypothetical protein C162_07839 [Paenibacillus sp. FSL R7-269]
MEKHTHKKRPFPYLTTPFRFLWNGMVYEYGTSDKYCVENKAGFEFDYGEVVLLSNTGKRDCIGTEIYVGDVFQRETEEYAVVELRFGQYRVVTFKPNQNQIQEKDTDQLLINFLKKYKNAEVIGNAWALGVFDLQLN